MYAHRSVPQFVVELAPKFRFQKMLSLSAAHDSHLLRYLLQKAP